MAIVSIPLPLGWQEREKWHDDRTRGYAQALHNIRQGRDDGMTRQEILEAIEAERQKQVVTWGPSQDAKRTPLDWHEMIADYNAWARRQAAMGNWEAAKERYIQIAALAVAAVEAVVWYGGEGKE